MWRLLQLRTSSRPTKKLAATFVDGTRTKLVHFGGAGYDDYTLSYARDPRMAKAKRRAYIARHRAHEKWTDPTSPGTLSRYILWEKPTVPQALRAFKMRFGV